MASVTVSDPITGLIQAGARIFDDLHFSGKEKADVALRARDQDLREQELDRDVQLAQLAINREDSKSASWFVSGWRPFVGWCCGIGVVLPGTAPWLLWPVTTAIRAIAPDFDIPPFPVVDTEVQRNLLYGMLGMGGARSFEKWKQVARSHMGETLPARVVETARQLVTGKATRPNWDHPNRQER